MRWWNCVMRIIGYTVYVDLQRTFLQVLDDADVKEVERCCLAFETAAEGKQVAMDLARRCCVYGMAGLMYELKNGSDIKCCNFQA